MTLFEVLGLGLKAYKSSKMPCPGPRIALFYGFLKMGQDHDCSFFSSRSTPETSRIIYEDLLFRERLKFYGKFASFLREDFFFYLLENTCALCPWSLSSSIPVLGLERLCPRKVSSWPWPQIFFPWPQPCVLDSTSDF